jgi:SPP1 gp7 family putative phage head morphogenesis protein
MAGTKTFLINASTRHAIYVNRYSGSQLKEMLPYLQRVKKATAAELALGDLTDFSRKRLKKTLAEIEDITQAVFDKMGGKLTSNMKKFATYEAGFTKKMLDQSAKVEFSKPSIAQIHAAVFSEPVLTLEDKGIVVQDVLDQFSQKKAKQLITTIQDGVILGKPNSDILKGMDYVIDTVMAEGLQSLIRTVTNHVSSVSRQEVYNNNEDIIDGYEWVSTLDGRTTETCMALDGQVFEVGKGPMPPAHWGCRSTTIPVVKKEYNVMGLIDNQRPAVGADGPEQDVSAKMDYQSWLKTQPNAFIDEVLGATKGAIFRDGGLTLDKFVDHNYQPLTLEQLKKAEPKAFDKAGL